MDKSLNAALDYIPRWLEHQMRLTEQPGVAIAVAHKGKVLMEAAFGHADLPAGIALTPRHRFRVASHSKTFTAAGVMRLRESGRLRLDDRIGSFVTGLHPLVAETTLAQLLSHTAGLIRDGTDSGQWTDRRPFLSRTELQADLAEPPIIDAGSRFKYSNHGFGLVGLAIEAITGERYADWIAREIVAASGLTETTPDAPIAEGTPFARGHSLKLPLGRRVAIPAANLTDALASATGFVSTAADLARFFASLSPDAKKSVLSPASRREMTRRHWRDPYGSLGRWYGLGTISSTLEDWEGFGHTGGFPGHITRTVCVPAQQLTFSVLTNAADGPSSAWLDGAMHIVRGFQRHGAPSSTTKGWHGRWWSLWATSDLLPVAGKVLVANPSLANPLLDATEIEPVRRGKDGTLHGRITQAGGFAQYGESVRLIHDSHDRAKAFWLAGMKLLPEARAAKELVEKYEAD